MVKQNLADFQLALMNRLQSADTESDIASWLAIEAGGHKYLLPLEEAGGVVALSTVSEIEKIAHTKEWFLGVHNLRGSPFSVIDLAGWLGLRGSTPNLKELARQGASLVTFSDTLGMSCSILVDKIFGLRSDVDWKKVKPGKNEDKSTLMFSDKEDNIWQVMRLSDLSRDEYFLSVEN